MTQHLYQPLIKTNENSTGMNNNINQELINIHNWMLTYFFFDKK